MFDSRTQVLTSTGWSDITNITTDTPIAQFNSVSAKFEGFIKPKRVWSEAYSGEMLCLADRHLSLLVTPDHMLYASRSSTPKRRSKPVFELQPANQPLYGRSEGKVLHDVAFRMRKASSGTKLTSTSFSPFDDLNPVAFARLIGFAASDGWADAKYPNRIRFHLKKQRKIDYLGHLYRALNNKVTREIRGFYEYNISYPELGRWAADALYVNKQKTLPIELLQCRQDVLEACLEGLMNGDGYRRGIDRWEYASTSEPLIDIMQAIGVIAGVPFARSYRGDCHRLETLTYKAYPHINDARLIHNHVGMLDRECEVFGMEIHFGVIAIRRDGRTLLIGSH